MRVEVHLPTNSRSEQQEPTVRRYIRQDGLAFEFHDRLRCTVPIEGMDVVLLVTILIEVVEYPFTVGRPPDKPTSVARNLCIADLSPITGIDIENEQLVATGFVVVERDLGTIRRHGGMMKRRKPSKLLEHVEVRVGHTTVLSMRKY